MEIISKAAAKARGLKRFFTGEQCKAGLHVDERYVSSGLCVACDRERNRARYQADEGVRERVKEASRARHHAKRDEIIAQARERYYANHEERKARNRAHHQANRDEINAKARDRYYADPGAYKERNRRARAENPEKYRELDRVRWQRYKARKLNAPGTFTADDVGRIVAEQGGKCVYCDALLDDGYEIDHKTPLSRGGSNWPENMQALCRRCNRSKGARTHDEVLASQAESA